MKRISPATVTFGVMAIVLGLVAAYTVRLALTRPVVVQRVVAPPAAETVPVVFARYNLPKNARLTTADVVVNQVPKTAKASQGTYRATTQTDGRITQTIIRAGQAIRDDYLLPLGEALPDLSERLPAGHRAVSIVLEGAETGGKRLSEGDHIDVTLTVEGTHPDLGEVMTRTILQGALVVDASYGRPSVRNSRRQNEPANSSITLAVLPADANRLIVAQRTGTLQATLVSAQSPVSTEASTSDAVTRRQLLGLKEVPPPRKFTIEKWSGSSLQVLEMSDDRIQESRVVTAARQGARENKPNQETTPVSFATPTGIKPHKAEFVPAEEPASETVPAAEQPK